MRTLVFCDDGKRTGGRRIREAHFEERSVFPVSAACVVANGVREMIAPLLGTAVDLRLFAPVVPSMQAWAAISAGATIFQISGAKTDAAVILRPQTCAALAAAAFGEARSNGGRALSALEERVLERLVRGLIPALTPVCGIPTDSLGPQRVASLSGYATYFELAVERPVEARIGVALSRDPVPEGGTVLSIDDLADIQIEVTVQTHGLPVPAAELAAVEPGAIVPITLRTSLNGTVCVAGRRIASGECGVRGNRLAVAIGLTSRTEGSSEPDHDR